MRQEIVGQAYGLVLEVGAGGGQNFLTWSGFEIVSRRLLGGGLQPFLIVHARRSEHFNATG